MSLKSVNDILGALKQTPQWEEPPFQKLLKLWPEVVGAGVAKHTRPLSIQRDVLWVATSSAAWAQNLTFGRQNILSKLNQQLSIPIADIRFSTADWKKSPLKPQNFTASATDHPSYLEHQTITPSEFPPGVNNAQTAFENWAKAIKERSHNLPLCPQCHCPTPPGELQRWGVCCLCVAKQLSPGNNRH
ncbi:hypothetical protein B6N60_03718 [Richelia sinica FACHB-800]|uniref:DUF721 domain-containing protein n=1 Tax=Richelia sinica FACHB-800 TaxID=1357546 RepID=A0A975TA42_9NOST|nr:DciA family protein [Richelia sinica]MBD2664100.1 DUF721 domain-containing protein [Richelia sinica FACHB-800]QXE25008.1 hypothetical protein B6N60_03718 [Richelia sinica FACHB-800]